MLAFKNLLRRKVRTFFALLGIAIGISAVVSIVSMARAMRFQFSRIADQFAYDLIVQRKGVRSPLMSAVTHKDRDKLLAIPGVQGASLFALHLISHPAQVQPIVALGLEPEGEVLSRYEILPGGRPLRPDDEAAMLLGDLAAKEMNVAPGGRLECEDGTWEVVRIFRAPVEGADMLSGQAIVNLAYLEKKYDRTPNLVIAHLRTGKDAFRTADRAALDATIAPVVSAVGTTKGLRHLQAQPFRDYLQKNFRQTELIDSFAWAISFLAALVGGIGIANTMLMSVFERTREIGLLRAVGWSRPRVAGLIVSEGLILSIVGGALGIPLGLLEVKVAMQVIKMGWLQVNYDAALYVEAVGLAALIGIVGSLYPGVRASGLEPTEALRYE